MYLQGEDRTPQCSGAAGVIIINSEDGIFEAPGADKGYSATIPVVMIRAKDAQELFSSGDSSGLKVQRSEKKAEAAVRNLSAKEAEDAVRKITLTLAETRPGWRSEMPSGKWGG